MKYADQITQKKESTEPYDLFFSLDCSDTERLHEFKKYFEEAKYKICVDHHFTNQGFGDLQFIVPDASSTCEVLFSMFDWEKISSACAQDLYMGIVHDTGVFKHTNTTRKTMETAGALLEKGIHSEDILIDILQKILCAESDTWKSTYGKYCTLTWKSNLFDYP